MKKFPLRTKLIAFTLKPFNPLMVLRATGRMGKNNIICVFFSISHFINFCYFYVFSGPKLVKKFRSDLIQRYSMLSGGDDSVIADYIYHCNAQTPS